MNNPQLNKQGELQHLLSMEGLPSRILYDILDRASAFVDGAGRGEIRKVPLLHGKSIFNIFFENSTRTRTTFEIAAKRLSADVVNLNIGSSSTSKGETLLDTVDNLCAMHADMFVVRHAQSGAAHLIAKHVAPEIHVINAGDGRHAHPTQALLDMFTIREKLARLQDLHVCIVGDIAHSRVARSNIYCLTKLGADVTVSGPATMLPREVERLGVRVAATIREAVRDADVIMMLRIQKERMGKILFPSVRDYSRFFGLTTDVMREAPPDAIVMHPGPMNRGVEISSEVADGPYSVILDQVEAGVAVRMAVLYLLIGATGDE